MIESSLHYPMFGAEITCPHCRQVIPALTLTDSYLCDRHGAFEADPNTTELTHVQSGRQWKRWEDQWYRQHTHPDGIRFEVHEALDRLYTQGFRATRITIAHRYQHLISRSLELKPVAIDPQEKLSTNSTFKPNVPHIYGLPVEFSSAGDHSQRWQIINFELTTEPGVPRRYPYYLAFKD